MNRVKLLLGATAASLAAALTPAFAQTAAVPTVEPGTQAFLDKLAAGGGAPIYTLSPEAARQVLESVQAGPAPAPAADEADRTIPGGPTGSIRIRTVRPHGAKGNLPVVMYFHGGGWILGSKATHDRLVRELATATRAEIVFVDYERSPEARYPVAIEQDYAATKYVAEHAREFGVDAARLAVAGDSVGGNMAAVVSLLAKERKGPAIRYQLLYYPVTYANFDDGSYNQFANGPWLTREAMKWFWNAYLPDAAARRDRHVSPLEASIDELEGLPPAMVVTDENDVLRDEGEAYAHKLASAGVPVTAVRYLGTIHDFMLLNPIAGAPATRSALALGSAALAKALAK